MCGNRDVVKRKLSKARITKECLTVDRVSKPDNEGSLHVVIEFYIDKYTLKYNTRNENLETKKKIMYQLVLLVTIMQFSAFAGIYFSNKLKVRLHLMLCLIKSP